MGSRGNIGSQIRHGVAATTRLQLARGTMLGLTTLATLVLLFVTPFSAEEGEFIHALRSGEITSVAVGHSADFYSYPATGVTPPKAENDIAVSWVNRFGFRREAVLDELGRFSAIGAANTETNQTKPALDPSASIVRTAESLGAVAPKFVQPGDLGFDHLKWLSLLATVLMIGVLSNGPQPRRMTKWGAFWVYLIPFNVGIFDALLRDSPWNRRMNLLPEPGPGVRGVVVDPLTNETIRRRGGGMMFIWSTLIASLVIPLVLAGVEWTFPTYLDPVGWSAVDMVGNRVTP